MITIDTLQARFDTWTYDEITRKRWALNNKKDFDFWLFNFLQEAHEAGTITILPTFANIDTNIFWKL